MSIRPHRVSPASSVLLALAALACGAGEPQADPGAARSHPGPPRFETRRERPVGGKPVGIVCADLDGDGAPEVLVACIEGLRVLRGTAGGPGAVELASDGPGWPLAPVVLPPGSFGCGESERPFAVASRSESSLAVLALRGAELATLARIDLGAVPRALAAGRFGPDGERSVVVATEGRRWAALGERGTRAGGELAGDLPRCLAVAGGAFVVGYQDLASLEWIDADGARGELRELGGIPRDLALSDLDGDGDRELAIVSGERALEVYGLGRGGGPREAMRADPLRLETETIPVALAPVDLDGDGTEELAVAHYYDLSWSLWTGWTGTDGPRVLQRGYAGQTPMDAAFGDVDGDGAPDLLVANRDSRAVSWIAGDGAGGLRGPRQVPVGAFPSSLAVSDAARDALVVVHSKSETLSWLERASGSLRVAGSVPAGAAPDAPLVADLDGDGTADIAWLTTDASGSSVRALFGGAAGYSARADRPAIGVGGRATDLAAFDVDGDGAPELVASDGTGGALVVLTGPGRPASERIALPGAPVATARLGAESLLVAVEGGAVLVLGRAEGTPSLAVRTSLAFDGHAVDLAAGDANGDGVPDVAWLARAASHSVAGRVELRLAEPGGGFGPGLRVETSQRPHRVRFADLDGDGREELLVASQDGHVVNAWRLGPDGRALERLADLGAHLGCLDVVPFDVDADGAPDLVVANGFSDDLSVVRIGR